VIIIVLGFKQLINAQTKRSILYSRHNYGILNNDLTQSETSTASREFAAAVKKEDKTSPGEFSLSQNNPNPFNLSTTIRYSLSRPARVKLTVYNVIGREIKSLVDSYQAEGNYQVVWNSTDNSNIVVSSGIYFCRMETGSFVSTKKMILMK
jgi:hypothetical protein